LTFDKKKALGTILSHHYAKNTGEDRAAILYDLMTGKKIGIVVYNGCDIY